MSKKFNLLLGLFFLSLTAHALDYSERIPSSAELERRFAAATAKQWVRENRMNLIHPDLPGGSAPGADDSAHDFLDAVHYESLADMEKAGLTSAELIESPWSDFYWPIYLGELAFRYNDSAFPTSSDWQANSEYVTRNLGKSGDEALSPSEKYDLLVGDNSFTLTHAMLEEGKVYYDRFHKVETWMGLCHGWAPASYSLPRPLHDVTLTAPDGKTLNFKPADIKALATLLWANAGVPTRFIGGRCEEKNPNLDPRNRPTDQTCLDNNPGTWHVVVVNQIGDLHKSFVMDRTYDYEVWNQPVVGYSYEYFNPKTHKPAHSLKAAQIALKDFKEDPYANVRAATATQIVGVRMAVTYGVETRPNARNYDSENFDAHNSDQYVYDLELDKTGKIVGGEWYQNQHPDFLWNPLPNSRALSPGDEYLARFNEAWNTKEKIPERWQQVATETSKYKMPLALIVEELIRAARI